MRPMRMSGRGVCPSIKIMHQSNREFRASEIHPPHTRRLCSKTMFMLRCTASCMARKFACHSLLRTWTSLQYESVGPVPSPPRRAAFRVRRRNADGDSELRPRSEHGRGAGGDISQASASPKDDPLDRIKDGLPLGVELIF